MYTVFVWGLDKYQRFPILFQKTRPILHAGLSSFHAYTSDISYIFPSWCSRYFVGQPAVNPNYSAEFFQIFKVSIIVLRVVNIVPSQIIIKPIQSLEIRQFTSVDVLLVSYNWQNEGTVCF